MRQALVITMILSTVLPLCGQAEPGGNQAKTAMPASAADRSSVERLLANWPPRPKLGALEMMAKYGAPQEATSEKLVWDRPGQFKRIMVTRTEIPHDFPKPHMDFLEHTIDYRVPADKASALLAYDGSVTINRTAGEMSARCDLEGHNILTLNLAHDIVTGGKNVEVARTAFGQNVVDDTLGKHPAYVEKLQFDPQAEGAAEPDEPVIPGSPKRATDSESGSGGGDAEILAFVIALDENEVLAAAEASKKKADKKVLDFAKTMHKEHGKNAADTMKLSEQMGLTPLDTGAVDALKVQGAGELAALISLDGEEFGRAYMAAMVKAHIEALNVIDKRLLSNASSEALKKHLTATREHVAMHLQKAKDIRAELAKL
jgi:predicted outer membrane protein